MQPSSAVQPKPVEPEPEPEPIEEQASDEEQAVESAGELSFEDLVSEDGTIDLSDVPERVRGELLPAGRYACTVDDVEHVESQRSGNPMLTWILITQDGEGRDRTLRYNTMLHNVAGLSRTKRAINALLQGDEEFDMKAFNPDALGEWAAGRECIARVYVQRETAEFDARNGVRDLFPAEANWSEE